MHNRAPDRQGPEGQHRLSYEEPFRLYGPEPSDVKWACRTLRRLDAQPRASGASAQDCADRVKAELILRWLEIFVLEFNPDQPRDEQGRWTSGGAVEKAVKYLEDHAVSLQDYLQMGPEERRKCATRVREALEAGGFDMKGHPVSAKDYEKFFENPDRGFTKVVSVKAGDGELPRWYTPQAGDVAVFQDIPGHSDGHIQMYSGTEWLSVFHQGRKFWPGEDYAVAMPRYAIFRHLRMATLSHRIP